MNFTVAQIEGMAGLFVWPLLRISSLFFAMPFYSAQSVPPRVRMLLAIAVTMTVLPLLPPGPDVALFSGEGFIVGAQQILVGLMAGAIIQLAFGAVIFAGQAIAYSMGLGFASLVDPQTGVQVPVVSQLYLMLTTLLFLSMDGHLLVIRLLIDSFESVPIAVYGILSADIWALIAWSGRLFAGGLLLALPLVSALLLINVSFGVATRSAPQLNIFSVGFPVTLFLGLLLLWVTVPSVLNLFSDLLGDSFGFLEQVLRLS